MQKLTVNQLLVLCKEIRNRLNDLRGLRNSVSTRERTYFGVNQENRKEVEPQYDFKAVDKKVTELENWLFKADAAIKQSNAMTVVDVDVDVDTLLAPLE